MHGDGTKLADIKNNTPPARLLDITRLVRRAGGIATGVDRVEVAYLAALLNDPTPVYGLARTAFGYILLDESGLQQFCDWYSNGTKAVRPDFLSRIQRGLTLKQRQAQTLIRHLAIGRASPYGFEKLLFKWIPQNTTYVNVGHSNITERVLKGVKNALNARIAILIHDIIPVEFPRYQRADRAGVFEKKLQRIQKYADMIIYNSADTRKKTIKYLKKFGNVPDGIVAHLGVDKPVADPDFKIPRRPYFVVVGTIEPRKNHLFLLDIWEKLGPRPPELYICGKRGWENEEVFHRLDLLSNNPYIHEYNTLSDSEITTLVGGASGFLFPSLCEGYGLPPVEAAALGVPVMCNKLEVLHEILGEIPVYLDVSDAYLWIQKIKELSVVDPKSRISKPFTPPSWDAHFKITLNEL